MSYTFYLKAKNGDITEVSMKNLDAVNYALLTLCQDVVFDEIDAIEFYSLKENRRFNTGGSLWLNGVFMGSFTEYYDNPCS